MCTNYVVFLQEEKDIVDMCTKCIVFLGGEKDCTHVY